MSTRILFRNALIIFAVGSLIYAVGKEISLHRKGAPAVEDPAGIPPGTRLIVYYFAEGKDCATCEHIPVYTKEVLDLDFSKELASGELLWRPVDVDDPRNEHFVNEYKIYTKSVVLVKVKDGKPLHGDNLEQVWDLVYNKPGFEDYIRKEVRAALEGAR